MVVSVDRVEEGPPDGVIDPSTRTRLDEDPSGDEDTRIAGGHIRRRCELAVGDPVVTCRRHALGRPTRFVLGNRNSGQGSFHHRLGCTPVRLEGDEHRDLMPHIREALGEVRHRFAEETSVRNVQDPPRRLVRVDPVTDFEEREAESPDIHHITRIPGDLDPVPHLEGPAEHDVDPAGQVEEDVRQRNGEAS